MLAFIDNFKDMPDRLLKYNEILLKGEDAWNHRNILKFRKNMLKGTYPVYCGKLCFLEDRSKN